MPEPTLPPTNGAAQVRPLKTSLLIMVLNEYPSMQVIMPQIKKEWVDEIIVMDGGSTDGSREYAESLGYRVVLQKRKGLIGAYHDALEIATGDVLIPFSPDGNSPAHCIPMLVEKMKEGYDMVIASRYYGNAKSDDDTLLTGFGNWLFTRAINFCFGGHYTDTLVMFRAWKRSLADRDPGVAGFEPYLAIKCAREKRPVADIEAGEPARIEGRRKVTVFLGGWLILVMIASEYCDVWLKRLGLRGNPG